MHNVVCENFSFKREGYRNENECTSTFTVATYDNTTNQLHKVVINVTIKKKDEYELLLEMSAIFKFDDGVPQEERDALLNYNAVAMLMPFVRSQISLLTAQPNVETVLLPVFDIYEFMNETTATN